MLCKLKQGFKNNKSKNCITYLLLWLSDLTSRTHVWHCYSHAQIFFNKAFHVNKVKPELLKFHVQFSSVQFSHSVMSDSLRPRESQHARPPCPSPTPGVHSNSRPLSRWCHPAISSSVVSFFSCPQSLPASESFPMSQLFIWGGQSTGVSALAS